MDRWSSRQHLQEQTAQLHPLNTARQVHHERLRALIQLTRHARSELDQPSGLTDGLQGGREAALRLCVREQAVDGAHVALKARQEAQVVVILSLCLDQGNQRGRDVATTMPGQGVTRDAAAVLGDGPQTHTADQVLVDGLAVRARTDRARPTHDDHDQPRQPAPQPRRTRRLPHQIPRQP